MTYQIKKKMKKEQNRSFTARDFESIRAQLLDTGRTYFPDKIQESMFALCLEAEVEHTFLTKYRISPSRLLVA